LVAIKDVILTLAFWLLVLGISLGLGQRLLKALALPLITPFEQRLFGFGLGAGALAYVVLALGLSALLNRIILVFLIIGLSWWLAPEFRELVRALLGMPRGMSRWWSGAPNLERSVAVLTGLIALVAVANALAPPWDYDGLMYHLVGPRRFLDAGRLFPDPDNWYINGPFAVEMLFTLGMAFGDDVYPKLLHVSMGGLLVASTFVAGRRWLGSKEAWLAVAVLLSVPLLPILASFAYIDLGWSAYEFLAIIGVIVAWQTGSRRWLVVAGTMMGLALASKYLALMGLALLALLVLILQRRDGWRAMMVSGMHFIAPAILIGAPWYVKNWLWLRNPVFPFFIGGLGWNRARLELYTSFLSSFGTGRGLWDYLLLPLNIYLHHDRFGAVLNRINIPSVLFPLALLYPLRRGHPVVTTLLWLAAFRFAVWAVGSQQIRFLFPVYPALALAVAFAISRLQGDFRRPWLARSLFPPLAVGLMVVPLAYGISLAWSMQVPATLLGLESRGDFLRRNVTAFEVLSTVSERPSGERVLLLGDGRSYYCAQDCLPDPEHFRWAAALGTMATCEDLSLWMSANRVSYVLLNLQDLDFLLQHDPSSKLRLATDLVANAVTAGCLRRAAGDDSAVIYELAQH
jgi:hypothetical protein